MRISSQRRGERRFGLGPQAIVVNPDPAGPQTQFPASLIENDGLSFFFLFFSGGVIKGVVCVKKKKKESSVLTGFVPEVAAVSLCSTAFQKPAIIFVLIVSWRQKINTLSHFAVLTPGLLFSRAFEVLSAFMEIKPLFNKLFHRLRERSAQTPFFFSSRRRHH